MTRETVFGKTDPLTGEARKYAEEHGGLNIHQAAAEIDALTAPIDGLSKAMCDARREIEQADKAKSRAEAKLREEIAAANQYVNLCAEIRVLKNDIQTATLALAEYESCIANAVTNFQTWPGQVRGVGHFGAWAREFGVQVCVAKKMIQLFPPWIESAKKRLATLEKETSAFAKLHGLKNESAPVKN